MYVLSGLHKVLVREFTNLQSHDSECGDLSMFRLAANDMHGACADGLEVNASFTSNIYLHLHLYSIHCIDRLLLSGLGPLTMLPPATCCCSFIPDPPLQP